MKTKMIEIRDRLTCIRSGYFQETRRRASEAAAREGRL